MSSILLAMFVFAGTLPAVAEGSKVYRTTAERDFREVVGAACPDLTTVVIPKEGL